MRSFSGLFRCAIVTAGLCAAPAFADNTFTASFSNFSYTLTDLDPSDAYTPTAPDLAQGRSAGGLWLLSFDPRLEIARDIDGPLFGAIGDSGATAPYSASWSVAANLDQNIALTSSGYGVGRTEAGFGIPIMLQPNTAVTISGHMSMEWTQTGTELPDTSRYMSSIFRIGEFVYGFNEVVYWFDAPDSIDTDMSVTYLYRGATPREVYITASLFASNSVFPPVPEPSTYAMLGAGLAVVGWAARRRQRPAHA